MKPYRLLLISCYKPDKPEGIKCSNQMLAWGLWNEFSKLPHVTLTYQNSDVPLGPQPPVDFTLMHCYFSAPILSQMNDVRALTAKRVINFMELGLPSEVVDHNFTYLPWQSHWAPTEVINFPYVGSLLKLDKPVEKWTGSVLLDHAWPISLLQGPQELWLDRLHGWLEPTRNSRTIGQLRRNGVDINPATTVQGRVVDAVASKQPPEWVRSIPETSYPEYLAATAPYENFVLTHPGSYEHSIIDMLARGIRVLVPVQNGKSFAPQAIVNQLRLPTFRTSEELQEQLRAPFEDNWRLQLLTDMPEIVCRIDAYCQREMQRG